MKRALLRLLPLLLLAALLSGCGQETPNQYTVQQDGVPYTVTLTESGSRSETGTITGGGETYTYLITVQEGGYSVEITYPDGSRFWQEGRDMDGFTTTSSGSDGGYDPDRYVSGETLVDVLSRKMAEPGDTGRQTGRAVLGAVLTLAGVLCIAFPRATWYLLSGWRYRGAEPSRAALTLHSLSGVLAAAIGIILFLSSL